MKHFCLVATFIVLRCASAHAELQPSLIDFSRRSAVVHAQVPLITQAAEAVARRTVDHPDAVIAADYRNIILKPAADTSMRWEGFGNEMMSRAGGLANMSSVRIKLGKAAPNDVVLLIAASGSTPYALGALREARAAGALTIALANNPGAPLIEQAEIGILLDTGAEMISGSTRLKAATAQKIALNSFSSALMVKLHKVHGNLMVDLRASNAKLRRRALHLTVLVSEASEAAAAQALAECGWRVKVAIVMLRCKLDAAGAEQRLAASEGSLRGALQSA